MTHNLSTRLFPRNDDAERANDEKLHALASTQAGANYTTGLHTTRGSHSRI